MQNILSFKEFYLRILEENFIVIDEISSFDSLFTNIGYIVSIYIYILNDLIFRLCLYQCELKFYVHIYIYIYIYIFVNRESKEDISSMTIKFSLQVKLLKLLKYFAYNRFSYLISMQWIFTSKAEYKSRIKIVCSRMNRI